MSSINTSPLGVPEPFPATVVERHEIDAFLGVGSVEERVRPLRRIRDLNFQYFDGYRITLIGK